MGDYARLYCTGLCNDWVHVDIADCKLVLARPASPPDVLRYGCPTCGKREEIAASPALIQHLRRYDVEIDITPCEMFEHGDGPPINHDDILAFHEALQAEEDAHGHPSLRPL